MCLLGRLVIWIFQPTLGMIEYWNNCQKLKQLTVLFHTHTQTELIVCNLIHPIMRGSHYGLEIVCIASVIFWVKMRNELYFGEVACTECQQFGHWTRPKCHFQRKKKFALNWTVWRDFWRLFKCVCMMETFHYSKLSNLNHWNITNRQVALRIR